MEPNKESINEETITDTFGKDHVSVVFMGHVGNEKIQL
jgi:hypothetical protein